MMLDLSMLVAGVAVFAITSYLFWALGKEGRISQRWKEATGAEAFWVFVILSGWAGGASLIARSVINLIAA